MSFQVFLNEIEKGLPSLVYLFHASDPFLNREAIRIVKKVVPEGEKEFNFPMFDFSREADEKTGMFTVVRGRLLTMLGASPDASGIGFLPMSLAALLLLVGMAVGCAGGYLAARQVR